MTTNVNSNEFVKIVPSVLSAIGSGFSLNGLLLTKNDNLPLGLPQYFTSADGVGEYLGVNSTEYAFAQKYFAANDNKTRTPSGLCICNYDLSAKAGWLRGGKISASVADFQAISDGTLEISFGGSDITLTGINLSSANSYSLIAAEIQTALRSAGQTDNFTNATVSYSSLLNAFVITSGAYVDGEVGYALDTDLSRLLKLQAIDGAVISPAQENDITLPAFMNNIVKSYTNWFSFAKNWELSTPEDNQVEDIAFATWCGLQGVRFAFFEHDLNSTDVDINADTDFASVIEELNISGTVSNYGSVELCAFAMGTIAAVNYNIANGRITLAFKTQSGLNPTCTNTPDYQALAFKKYNSYVRDGSAGNTFFGYQRGTISGNYGFIDAYANHVWLNDAMQVSIRALLGSKNSMPYNHSSYSQILNSIKTNIDTALNAGVISLGIDLDLSQISAIASQIGWEINEVKNVLYQNGWLFQAVSPSAAVRAERGTPIINFYYVDGGAIQKITLLSTAVR